MFLSKRIFVILGVGSFCIALELLVFSVLNREMRQIADSLAIAFQRLGRVVDVVSAAGKLNRPLPIPQKFQWNWREWQELNADQSLRNAKLTEHDRQAIAAAIASQLRPSMSDLEIESEDQLWKAALDTRIKMIDLNHDEIPEVVAQGMVGCSPTGNCLFWIFQKAHVGYRLLLKGEGQTFTVQKTITNGFRDIVLSMHGSATESGLTDYRYKGGVYHDVGCYDASWSVVEDGKERELKEPLITPCGSR